LTIPQTGFILL